ncbi:MAG: hypothetical protein ACR2M8_09600, partial [Pyrinomonadaceae bacterium]
MLVFVFECTDLAPKVGYLLGAAAFLRAQLDLTLCFCVQRLPELTFPRDEGRINTLAKIDARLVEHFGQTT